MCNEYTYLTPASVGQLGWQKAGSLMRPEADKAEDAASLCGVHKIKQEVKVIWQKAPHGGPIPRLGVTPGAGKLYRWIPGVGFPISVP